MNRNTEHTDYWPPGLPRKVTWRNGEKPLHEYLFDNERDIPDRAAYIFYGREVTWGELGQSVRKLAAFLKEKGVGKGDRVGLYMQNCPQFPIALYAIQMVGAIVSPLNPQYKDAEVEYQLSNAETRAVIVTEDLLATIQRVQPNVPSLAVVVCTPFADYLPLHPTLDVPEFLTERYPVANGAVELSQILDDYQPLDQAEPIDLWNDISLMTFTSGTTGRPKGAMLSFGSALYKTAASMMANKVEPDGCTLAVAPFCHIAGMNSGVYMPVYTRRTTVILPRFDPETVVRAFEVYRCDMWYSIAPMLRAILDMPGIEQRNLRCICNNPATSFGIPVTEELADEWKALTGCQIHEASFGLSETHTSDTFMPKEKIKWGSCGIPMPENEIRILDIESGEPLPKGQSGQIVIRNKGVFRGYWKQPDATAETLRDGWVHTGDVGYFDKDGYLFFTGRIKEMIKCSGYSVFPEDVEALMLRHPSITQCAAIGVPDMKRGETVKLVAVLNPDYKGQVSEQELIDWARNNMAAYKYPRIVEFRDSLPATGAGKVLRRLLKD
ncbi:AMP-binding protein [Marinobacter sp. F3R11]|uniref:AMP-binding protein n=1 Tax=Marinobacter sp. F3R11 TaxID=2267231 RepID=UPI000DEAA933|nr:AMP-binding protein [Marinobacter sp. F3R11]RBW48908.1 AMP-dependent synthetase [Marinobacter sp. F3R11]